MVTTDGTLAGRLVTAIEARLKVKDHKVQKLAVTLVETCVKNCGRDVHRAVGTKSFLQAVAAVGESSSNGETREKALAVIEQWGMAFEPLKDEFPAYVEMYANLKVRGVAFPAPDDAPPVLMTSPPDDDDKDVAMAKLKMDLDVVSEKISLCNDMVPNSSGVDTDDALAEVVGFLEACRPRMLDLIDQGTRGALTDDLLEFALKVNDDIAKALDAIEEPPSSTQSPPQPPIPAPLASLSIDDDDDDDGSHDLRRPGKPQQKSQSSSSDLLDLTAFDPPAPPPPPQGEQPLQQRTSPPQQQQQPDFL